MAPPPTPFHISIPQSKLDSILARVNAYPFPSTTSYVPTWAPGPLPADIRDICTYWTSDYDWRLAEARLNALPNYTVPIQDQTIHFIYERGSGARPRALLLLHGWPYSALSYAHLVPRLAHPERFGGTAADAFDVVVPSLPGFGFSGKPRTPLNPPRIAAIVNELMTDVLGYESYVAHGGDWGSYVCELLGYSYPEHCDGIHITMSSVRHFGGKPRSGEYVAGASEKEIAFAKKEKELWEAEKAYNLLQSTRPLKLAYAMMDSPVGTLAYILEAWHAWADLRGRKLTEVFGMDRLLDEVMVYLVTDTFNTSMWIYAADHETGTWTLPEGKMIEAPVGVLACPDPVFPMPPFEVLERSRRVVQWREVDKGGHFPFYEVEDVVMEELVDFGKLMRHYT